MEVQTMMMTIRGWLPIDRCLVALAAILVLAAAPRASAAQAAAPGEIGAVRSMLAGYESFPSDAEWKALGEQGVAGLIEICRNENEATQIRARAMAALGACDTEAARVFLRDALTTAKNEMLRRAAIRAYGRTGAGDRIEAIAPVLRADDPYTRIAAAEALARTGDPAAVAAVAGAMGTEMEAFVRARIERSLKAAERKKTE